MNIMNTAGATLPIIDGERLTSNDPAALAAEVDVLRQACERNGFFYVANHGVDQSVIDEALTASKAFFSLPLAEKSRVTKDASRCNRGYEPLQGQTLEKGAPPDLKEGFYFGVDISESDPRVQAGVFSLGPNQVPDTPSNFGSALSAYHEAMRTLCVTLMRGLALSLRLDAHHFDAFSNGPMAIVRLLHYPPQPVSAAPGEKGCGEHTDFGGITVLLQDSAGGLEVWDQRAQSWMPAPPIPGTFVVNLGDMMDRWTNGRYRSTLHRVINTSGTERYSIPYFLSGEPDMVIACLPTCTSDADPPRHEPVTVTSHFRMKFEQSYDKT